MFLVLTGYFGTHGIPRSLHITSYDLPLSLSSKINFWDLLVKVHTQDVRLKIPGRFLCFSSLLTIALKKFVKIVFSMFSFTESLLLSIVSLASDLAAGTTLVFLVSTS